MPKFTFAKRGARPAFEILVSESKNILSAISNDVDLSDYVVRNLIASELDLGVVYDKRHQQWDSVAIIAELNASRASSSSILKAAEFDELWSDIAAKIGERFAGNAMLVKETLILATGHGGRVKLAEGQADFILKAFSDVVNDNAIYSFAVGAAKFKIEESKKAADKFAGLSALL